MFVGREHEIRLIRTWLAEAAESPALLHVIQVEGPVGIGKTAVVTAAAAASDRRTFVSRADGIRSTGPLHAHRTLLEHLLGEELEALLDSASPHSLGLRCAERLAAAPTLLIVDDAQWLDPASQTFLTALAGQPSSAPLSVILAHRPRHTTIPLLEEISRWGARHDFLPLSSLPQEDAAQIVSDLPAQQQESALELSRGNPLFLHSLAAAFRLHPHVSTAAELLPHATRSPQSLLRAAVGTEVEALPPAARTVLLVLAAANRDLATGSLARVTDLSESEVSDALARLRWDGLLAGEAERENLHPAIRHTVYQSARPQARHTVHRSLAELTELEPFERAEHVVRLGSELTASDLCLLLRSAEIALESDPEAAFRWLSPVPARLRTAESELLTAQTEMRTGRIDAAAARLRPLSEAPPAAGARELLGQALRMQGNLAEAREVLAEGVLHDTSGTDMAVLRELVALQSLLDGHADPTLLTRLDTSPAPADQAAAQSYRAIDLLGRGHVPEARPAVARALTWMLDAPAAELRDHLDAAAATVWSAYALDDFASGIALGERALRIARRHGRGHVTANLGAGLAYCLTNAGRLHEADAAAEQAVLDADRFGSQGVQGMAVTALAQSARWQRDDALLSVRYQQLCDVELPEAGWWRRTVLTSRARTAALLGEQFSHVFESDPPDATIGYRYCDAGTVLSAEGRMAEAVALLEEGLQVTAEQRIEIQHAMVATTLAEILLRSAPVRARSLFDTAHEVFSRLGMPAHLGRVRAGLAQAEAVRDPWAPLTRREREVAELIAQGFTNGAIADHLFISKRTAEEHVSKILRKLDVTSRAGVISLGGSAAS